MSGLPLYSRRRNALKAVVDSNKVQKLSIALMTNLCSVSVAPLYQDSTSFSVERSAVPDNSPFSPTLTCESRGPVQFGVARAPCTLHTKSERSVVARSRYVTNAITSPLLPLYLTGTSHPLLACMHLRLTAGRAAAGPIISVPAARARARGAICAQPAAAAAVLIQLFLMGMAAPRRRQKLRHAREVN